MFNNHASLMSTLLIKLPSNLRDKTLSQPCSCLLLLIKLFFRPKITVSKMLLTDKNNTFTYHFMPNNLERCLLFHISGSSLIFMQLNQDIRMDLSFNSILLVSESKVRWQINSAVFEIATRRMLETKVGRQFPSHSSSLLEGECFISFFNS